MNKMKGCKASLENWIDNFQQGQYQLEIDTER